MEALLPVVVLVFGAWLVWADRRCPFDGPDG